MTVCAGVREKEWDHPGEKSLRTAFSHCQLVSGTFVSPILMYMPHLQVNKATHGMVDKPWPAQLNKAVWEKRHTKEKSLVLSIGQVVPHGKKENN